MSSRTRSEFGTLGERSAGEVSDAAAGSSAGMAAEPGADHPHDASAHDASAHDASARGAPAVQFVDAQHVWVDGSQAGLLFAWRRLGDWQGRVFWCPPDQPEAVIDWLPRDRLSPRG